MSRVIQGAAGVEPLTGGSGSQIMFIRIVNNSGAFALPARMQIDDKPEQDCGTLQPDQRSEVISIQGTSKPFTLKVWVGKDLLMVNVTKDGLRKQKKSPGKANQTPASKKKPRQSKKVTA